MQTLRSYLARRLLLYTIMLDGTLCLLATMVEGFERLLRTHHVATSTILHYTTLQLVPNLITYLPLAMWLATVLLIRTLRTRGEWEVLEQLGMPPSTIACQLLCSALLLAGAAALCYETVGYRLAGTAQQIRLTAFKQLDTGSIHATWFPLKGKDVCYLHHLDLATGQGSGLVCIQFDRLGTTTVLHAAEVFYEHASQTFTCATARLTNLYDGRSNTLTYFQLYVPALSWQHLLATEQLSVLQMSQHLVTASQALPPALLASLRHKLVSRLMLYVQVILYPVLTLATMLLLTATSWSWLGMLLPCITITLFSLALETAAGPASWPLLLALHFLLALAGWCILRRRI